MLWPPLHSCIEVWLRVRRLQAVADDLAELVPREGGAIAVPTDITSSEDVGALAERCGLDRLTMS